MRPLVLATLLGACAAPRPPDDVDTTDDPDRPTDTDLPRPEDSEVDDSGVLDTLVPDDTDVETETDPPHTGSTGLWGHTGDTGIPQDTFVDHPDTGAEPPTPKQGVRGRLSDILEEPIWCVTRSGRRDGEALVFFGLTSGDHFAVPIPWRPGLHTARGLGRVPEGFVFWDAGWNHVFDPFTHTHRALPNDRASRTLSTTDGDVLLGLAGHPSLPLPVLVGWAEADAWIADVRSSEVTLERGANPTWANGTLVAWLDPQQHVLRRAWQASGNGAGASAMERVPGENRGDWYEADVDVVGDRVIVLDPSPGPFHGRVDAWVTVRDLGSGRYLDGLVLDLGARGLDRGMFGLWCEEGGGEPELDTGAEHLPDTGDDPAEGRPVPSAEPCADGVAAVVGPLGFPTVKSALKRSAPGDTVEVCPGTWPLSTPLLRSTVSHTGPLVLRSRSGNAADTKLTGAGRRGRLLDLPAGMHLTLEDLTLSDGGGPWVESGGLVAPVVSKLRIERCTFEGQLGLAVNTSHRAGLAGTPIRIVDSTFRGIRGLGLQVVYPDFARRWAQHVVVERSTFTDNAEGAVRFWSAGGRLVLRDTTFSGTSGSSALELADGPFRAVVDGCAFEDNEVTAGASAVAYTRHTAARPSDLTFTDTRFVRNQGGTGAVSTVRGARMTFVGVDFGEGVDDNAPADVAGCTADYGAQSSFLLDVGAGCP